ncbi:uncharacterized protein EHS24_003901 [Apiotrichum porosum]|uniref:Major facilitator superfamily (MFS) profile domain-containing protein n=1 Tax=Apiotrichum porosum TaxID=105984 RepID=A0A427XDQ9_9TREE|nr:uncharacterized protein EHS24_003901 [Apiotrichum porosum]RSH76962.1 hypothetical protein EHS24_003901 [Apiotrichum porosum]
MTANAVYEDTKADLHQVENTETTKLEMEREAMEAEAKEHSMGMLEAVRTYPMACFWAFVMSFTIVMESFDMFLIGNFVALPSFKEEFGVYLEASNEWVIPTKWQSALTMAGQIGALLGIFICGPISNRWGYRISTMVGLVLMNATIFISFFGKSLAVLVVGQLLEGVPWGFFIANSPAYASEVAPLALRSVCTAYLQMCWAIGSIIVGASTYALNQRTDEWAYRIPFALQWLFPTPLLILLIFMPESPWWLVRKGRLDQARRSIERLGRKSAQNTDDTLAMMVRTVEIETQTTAEPTYLDLFRGIDKRRTAIICLVYAGQNLAGNLIANQAVFFFEQAGMSTDFSFQLGLITSCLQMFAVGCSWLLSSWFGRRTIYLYGTFVNTVFLFALGIIATASSSSKAQFAQACLGVIISFTFALTLGPISYTIIAETSSVHLRALSTGVGRAAYYIVEIPCIYLASQMLNPTGWNLAGKCGYVWGGTATLCLALAYFGLPEMRNRSYRELDVLFHRKVSARKFASTVVDPQDMD